MNPNDWPLMTIAAVILLITTGVTLSVAAINGTIDMEWYAATMTALTVGTAGPVAIARGKIAAAKKTADATVAASPVEYAELDYEEAP
jgi:hypothetical protein